MILTIKSRYRGTGLVDEFGNDLKPELLDLPKELVDELRGWISVDSDDYDDYLKGDVQPTNHAKFFETGLNLAKKLKKLVGDKHKVMYEYSEVKLLTNGDTQYTPLNPLDIINRKITDMVEGFKGFSDDEISEEETELKNELTKILKILKIRLKNLEKIFQKNR